MSIRLAYVVNTGRVKHCTYFRNGSSGQTVPEACQPQAFIPRSTASQPYGCQTPKFYYGGFQRNERVPEYHHGLLLFPWKSASDTIKFVPKSVRNPFKFNKQNAHICQLSLSAAEGFPAVSFDAHRAGAGNICLSPYSMHAVIAVYTTKLSISLSYPALRNYNKFRHFF